MSQKIIKLIFFVLVAGVLLYLFRSGFVTNGLHAISKISFQSSSSSSGGLFFNNGSSGNTYNGTNDGIVNNDGTVSGSEINPSDVPAGFTLSQISPYFHRVRLSGVSYGSFGYYGTINLSVYGLPGTSTLNVTAWQIKARHGGEFIPQAVNVYDPSGLTAPSDIVVKNGDTVYLYSSRGPFNLRLNKCIGYIAKNNQTMPQIPASCPYIDRSVVQNFTGACQNYVSSIGGCVQPDLNDPRIPFNDYSCRNYLANNFTYQSCFNAHAGDADFLSNQIWVWTGNNVVDQYHDQVQLLDRNGLLVDVYNY